MKSANCPLCASRKAKRACPALNKPICPVCCATKRQVQISCPADCAYLSSARNHPPAVIQRRQERDLRFLLPFITNLTEEQFRIMLFVQSVVLRESKSALPPLLDSDICEAASTVAATLETAGKGIIYEHQATSIPAQRLVGEIRDALSKIGDLAGSARARAERDAAVALRQIERAAAAAGKELADEEPPVYLRLVGRILQALPNTTGRSAPGGDDTPRLVIPGQ